MEKTITVIDAIMQIGTKGDGPFTEIDLAVSELAKLRKLQDECKSDWSWWNYELDISYWSAVVDIIEAGKLNNGLVSRIEAPKTKGILMDVSYNVEQYGKKILEETKKLVDGSK